VLDAGVRALAVHHHRARQHQAGDPGPGHLGQQHGGAQVVTADIVGQVGQVHTHADHGGLVHHDIDIA
jgi:hypothetical protein